jgi:serine-type D-Ala-D-Ala carboxypeptidase/endopeptidase (penicillin-binding protein 4)
VSRGDTARWVVTGVLGVAAVGCLFVGLRESSDAGAAAGPPTTGPASAHRSPVWSPRRVPEPFVVAVGATNLQASLDSLVAGTDSCFRVDAAGAGTVARSGEGTPVTPASTEKILNAVGSLGVLGAESTFTTSAVSSATPTNGAVDRVWLVGGGDPVLSTPEWTAMREGESEYTGLTGTFTPLTKLADAIAATGVKTIPGGIIGDSSEYTTPLYLPTWPALDRSEVGALGALVVDDGFDLATGTLAPDPALSAAATLSTMLVARGIAVGPPSTGVAPAGATPLASIHSAPLTDLVTEMLSASDNGTAERLALAVGKATSGAGTTAAGIAGITDTLRTAGVDLTGVTLVDASGLSAQNRLTCNSLLETLELGAQPRFRAMVDGLAIAAKRGTLLERFGGTPLEGRLFAKTGTLTGVAGLAGLFDVGAGTGTPRFASVFNGGFTNAGGIGLTNQAAVAVNAYPQSPPPDQLVPAP